MPATVLESNNAISSEQKQAAVEAILRSQTFARADQLKSFLKYICEMEQAGRGHELTEYLIGVEALGRPVNYSPNDDSAVRNRAFALRKKLQEYFEHEQPNAQVRIELNRGSYCPHFWLAVAEEETSASIPTSAHNTAHNKESLSSLSVDNVSSAQSSDNVSQPSSHFAAARSGWIGFAAGIGLTLVVIASIYGFTAMRSSSAQRTDALASILFEAWGPLLKKDADVLVCVGNPPSISIHPDTVSGSSAVPFNDPKSQPAPAEISQWLKGRFPSLTDKQYLTPTTNATYWGDTLAAITAFKTVTSNGSKPSLFPERVLSIPALRQRNVVLVGAGAYSPAIAHFMEKCPLSANFLTSIAPTGQPEKMLFQIKRDQSQRLTQLYGLITVMPSDSSVNQQHRTIIFSGINSAGTQAAAEFFSSPENLQALKQQLAKDGHTTFPPAYQVVIRVETDDNILLNYHYETYRIIQLPQPR